MVKTLLKFLVILTIFFLAYAVASEAVLYPESKMSWALVFHVLRKPYWSMYGELFLDELEADGSDPCTVCTNDPNLYDEYDELRCASKIGRYVVPVFLGIYVLIVNILLLNLLIAKFSSTVQKDEDRSEELWSYQRAVMLREFSRYILPFPFTLITLLLLFVRQPQDPFSYVSSELIPHMESQTQDENGNRDLVMQEVEERLREIVLRISTTLPVGPPVPGETVEELMEKVEKALRENTSLLPAPPVTGESIAERLDRIEEILRKNEKLFTAPSKSGESMVVLKTSEEPQRENTYLLTSGQDSENTIERLTRIENLLSQRLPPGYTGQGGSVEGNLITRIEELLRDRDGRNSCTYCCVCGENQKTLESVDKRLEELLRRKESKKRGKGSKIPAECDPDGPPKSPKGRKRLRHSKSWDPSVIRYDDSPGRGSQALFYEV